jgi:hypothetical protein
LPDVAAFDCARFLSVGKPGSKELRFRVLMLPPRYYWHEKIKKLFPKLLLENFT